MKKLLIIAVIILGSLTLHAQQLKFKNLKDSAIYYFCLVQKTGNSHAPMEEFRRVLDIYDHYRTLCLAHLKTKKEKDAFLKLVAESCPHQGKI